MNECVNHYIIKKYNISLQKINKTKWITWFIKYFDTVIWIKTIVNLSFILQKLYYFPYQHFIIIITKVISLEYVLVLQYIRCFIVVHLCHLCFIICSHVRLTGLSSNVHKLSFTLE